MVVPNTIEIPGGSSVGGLDVFAATRIVSLIPGEGTDLTIAAAIAALPAAGGTIFIKQGTYPQAAPLVMPAKNVKIVGAGRGATFIDLGVAAINCFTLGFPRAYTFEDFSIIGSNVAGQRGFHWTAFAPGALDDVTVISRVDIGWDYPGVTMKSLETCIESNTASQQIRINDCNFLVPDLVTSFYLKAGGLFKITKSRFRSRNPVNAGKIGNVGFAATPLQLVMDDVEIDCFQDCKAAFFNATKCQFNNGIVTPNGGIGSRFVECEFTVQVLAPFDKPHCLNLTAGDGTLTTVIGCYFNGGTSEAIQIAGDRNRIIGNRGCKVTEVGLVVDSNIYDNNEGFTGSVILGLNSVVNGMRRADVIGGVTTGAFVAQFTHINQKGLVGVGTVKNTGAFAMEVMETVTDAFGVIDSVTTTVLPGNDYMLDLQTNFATARPPYIKYAVAVRHPVAATTFDLRHGSQGEVS